MSEQGLFEAKAEAVVRIALEGLCRAAPPGRYTARRQALAALLRQATMWASADDPAPLAQHWRAALKTEAALAPLRRELLSAARRGRIAALVSGLVGGALMGFGVAASRHSVLWPEEVRNAVVRSAAASVSRTFRSRL